MRIKPEWVYGTLIVKNDRGGYVFSSDVWPSRLAIGDLLRALCGEPDSDGWFVCHEVHGWLEKNLLSVAQLSLSEIGLLAIRDAADLGGDDSGELTSLSAAGTLAVAIFEKSFGASRSDAELLVRMNIIGSAKIAGA